MGVEYECFSCALLTLHLSVMYSCCNYVKWRNDVGEARIAGRLGRPEATGACSWGIFNGALSICIFMNIVYLGIYLNVFAGGRVGNYMVIMHFENQHTKVGMPAIINNQI